MAACLLSMKFVAHNSTKSPFALAPPCTMAPQHSFLFDMPFRFVVGMGITAGTVWALFKPTDVALAEEVTKPKGKVLVRTASGAVRPAPPRATPLPASRLPLMFHRLTSYRVLLASRSCHPCLARTA